MDKNSYSATFIANLFNKMSLSYGRMNTLTSFGFYPLWRKQSINKIVIKPGDHVTDLLTGAGECWPFILKKIGVSGKLTALDFSEGMLKKAMLRRQKYPEYTIKIIEEDVFENTIPSNSQDIVICAYGLKTFTHEQLSDFASEIHRILKPNGQFSLVDVSLPKIKWLKRLYLFYIVRVIPLLGIVLSGDRESYTMLGVYAKKFKDSKNTIPLFTACGFSVCYCRYFFGCATGIYGKKLERF